MASNYPSLYLVLEQTIPWTFWAGSFLSRFTGVHLVLENFRQEWGISVFALFA